MNWITQILEETGYGGYASAMPGGVQRRANLEMLVEKAGGVRGDELPRPVQLYPLYRTASRSMKWISGEVNIYGESADTVRIMSIHKE